MQFIEIFADKRRTGTYHKAFSTIAQTVFINQFRHGTLIIILIFCRTIGTEPASNQQHITDTER